MIKQVGVFMLACGLTGGAYGLQTEEGWYETWGSWSPDGETLYGYSYGYGGPAELISIGVDGRDRERLIPRQGNEWFPVASHSGRFLAFVSDYNFRPLTGTEIYTLDRETGDIRQLTADTAMKFVAAWSPDDAHIVYAAPGENDFYDLWMMDADGSNKVNLTNTPDRHEMRPHFHPDGDRLVFTGLQAGAEWGERESDLYVLDLPTRERRQVTMLDGQETRPEFSPDGSRIVFSHRHGDMNYDIYTISADGQDLRQLTHHPESDHMPHWSPDGLQISFATYRWGHMSEIYVMAADGTGLRNVTRSTVDRN